MKRLLLPLLLLAFAPPVARPYCATWLQAFESPAHVLVLVPLVAARTEQTRVEVWVHIAPTTPATASGWYQASQDVPAGWMVWWDKHGLAAGRHAVTMEVFEGDQRVDGWQQPSMCLTTVETR